MSLYPLNQAVFENENVEQSSAQVMIQVHKQLADRGFPIGQGIVYNYGIWKPKKSTFCFIAGTMSLLASQVEGEGANQISCSSGPPRAPTYFLAKAMVSMLKVVIESLKEVDLLQ